MFFLVREKVLKTSLVELNLPDNYRVLESRLHCLQLRCLRDVGPTFVAYGYTSRLVFINMFRECIMSGGTYFMFMCIECGCLMH